MRTVIDMIKALDSFSPTAPVQIGLMGPDDGLVVHEIAAIEAREGVVVLLVECRTPGEAPEARVVEADQTGEAIAVPPPPAVPSGLEGEGEEPEPPKTEAGRPSDRV